MIGVNVNSLPYEQKITREMIKYLRLCRNLTQAKFGEVCKVDQGVLAKLERGDLQLSPHYETKILEGCRALNISNVEMVSIKRIVELKQRKLEA
ncbi:helix-turn-helix transcriptional regulator [Peribacillus simplex]|uniref:helix-turn-helix domain-containing protein n=1 Tax=Peribacillus simplex TaxID=1478 RepID=UPI002E219160|nr:helix-turn-helix transcriptional regulator [Peribacillus simplex]